MAQAGNALSCCSSSQCNGMQDISDRRMYQDFVLQNLLGQVLGTRQCNGSFPKGKADWLKTEIGEFEKYACEERQF
jgi:hypothetical protein